MLDTIVQWCILIFGGASVTLLASGNPRTSRWGWLCGLLSAPMWTYATWPFDGDVENWGIFALSIWYGVQWMRGTMTFLVRGERKR